MKKNYLLKCVAILFVFLGLSSVVNAQSEIDVTGQAWDWSWNGTGEKVNNPLKNATNGNDQVWLFTPTQQWGGFCYGIEAGLGIDFAKYSTFECLVYCPDATKAIKLYIEAEGAGNGVDLGLIDCKNGWAIATGSVAAWDSSKAIKFAIKNGDNTSGGMKIYFDKIRFIDPSSAPAIIFDNAETVTKAWDWSWGGMTNATVANPKKNAVNGTDYVREINATAEWAGLAQGYNGTTVAEEIDFATFSRFEMMVYCPDVASLQLMVGINDSDGGANFEINEACSAGWVKVTKDVASWAGNTSDKIFIKNGNGTANKSIYIDEIQFVNPSAVGIEDVAKPATLENAISFDGENITMEASGVFKYAIYNSMGAMIAQGTASSSEEFNASGLPVGIYIVKLFTKNGDLSKKVSIF